MTSTKKQLAANAVVNWAGTVAQTVAIFLVAPVLVHGLGDERYGVWALVESILAYLTLFDLGIAAALMRYIARFDGSQDLASLNKTFSASLVLFILAGLGLLLIAAIILGPAWPLIPVPREFRYEAWWQLAILSFNLAVGLPMGVFPTVLFGLQRYIPQNVVRMITLVIRSVALVVIVRNGGGLMAIALAVTAVSLIEHVILAILAFYYLPGLRFTPRAVDRSAVGMIGGYSVNAFMAMIAGRISFQTDSIVIGAFLPLSQITFFAIPARLCEHIKGALRSLTIVLTPHVSQLEGKDDFNAIRRVYVTGTRYVLWLVIPLQLGLWLLGKSFIALWIGPDHAEQSFLTLIILAAPLALALSQSIAGRILYGIGDLRFFSRLVLVEAFANIGLSLLLVRPYGIEGVALGTCIPNILANLAIAHHTCATLGISSRAYARQAFVAPLTASLIPAMIWMFLPLEFPMSSWQRLIAVGVVGLMAYLPCAVALELGVRRFKEKLYRLILDRSPPTSECDRT